MGGLTTEANPSAIPMERNAFDELKELKKKEGELKEKLRKEFIEKQKVDVIEHKHCQVCKRPMPLIADTICVICKPPQ